MSEESDVLDIEDDDLATIDEDSGDLASEPSDEDVLALDLPAAPRPALDVRELALEDIAELGNIRPAYHGIAGLADTMHLEGQLQAIVVRPAVNAAHDKPFELLFGHRRKRAAEMLAWDTIRAEVRTDASDQSVVSQMIVENFQREDLSEVAEANAMRALKFSVEPPMSNAAVARRLGCDPSHVSHRLKMIRKLALPVEEEDDPDMEIVDTVEPQTAQAAVSEADEHQDELAVADVASGEEDGDSPRLSAPEPSAAVVKPKRLDILALIDQGVIDGSTGEVIASLDRREDQEKLAKLCIRNEWGVKKAAAWARAAKKHELDEGDDAVMGSVEMLRMDDVVDLQRLHPKPDLTEQDIAKITLYALLRNAMDAEILEHLAERMGYPYEQLWDYVSELTGEQVSELTRRMALRYISAAHRFFDLEPSLKDQLGIPEEASAEDRELAQEAFQVALPAGGDMDVWSVPALPDATDSWNALPEADGDDDA